jgi:hypothetical protein
MPDASALPTSPLHALCVYAEPLVVGRRVVVLGDTRRCLGERLLDLGARVVHVYDPDAARAGAASVHAPRGLTVHPLPPGEFDVRDGAFDVAIIADVADIPHPAAVLGRVRRLLAPGGAVLVRSASADAQAGAKPGRGSLDYYELYDLVAMQFAHVHMVGQVPWSGVALAELGRGGEEPDVTVDTQLLTETALPEAFIAVGSQEDVHLAEYALIQLPHAAPVDADVAIAPASERADFAAAQLRASLLEAQVEELRARRNNEGAAHADAVGALEAELANRLTELQLVESRTSQANARAERAAADLRARDEDLARVRDRATLTVKELDDERRLRSRAEVALAASLASAEAARQGADERAVTFERATALEAAALAMQGRVLELSRTLAASEDARGMIEAALVASEDARGMTDGALVASEDARARVEAALTLSLVEIESLRTEEARDDGAATQVSLAGARIAQLEGQVVALERELGGLSHGHVAELVSLEEALRERGRATHALERELERRERLVLDLVHALEEARDAVASGPAPVVASSSADAEALRETTRRVERMRAENADLRMKLDAAAMEIARREAESTTSAWRVQELEQAVARLEDEQSELTMTIPPPAFLNLEREVNDVTKVTERLAAAEDELDVLRQALAQELARQAALLEKLSKELEAHDGVRRVSDAASGSA